MIGGWVCVCLAVAAYFVRNWQMDQRATRDRIIGMSELANAFTQSRFDTSSAASRSRSTASSAVSQPASTCSFFHRRGRPLSSCF